MDECAICFDEVNEATGFTRLACSHSYHLGCIVKWLSKCANCPVCRRQTSTYESVPRNELVQEDLDDFVANAVAERYLEEAGEALASQIEDHILEYQGRYTNPGYTNPGGFISAERYLARFLDTIEITGDDSDPPIQDPPELVRLSVTQLPIYLVGSSAVLNSAALNPAAEEFVPQPHSATHAPEVPSQQTPYSPPPEGPQGQDA
jgi:hypothetical protein